MTFDPGKSVVGIKDSPHRFIIYGREDIGKSSFPVYQTGKVAPKPYYLNLENRLDHIDAIKSPLIDSYDDFVHALIWLRDNKEHGRDMVVIDTVTKLQQLIFDATTAHYGLSAITDKPETFGSCYPYAQTLASEVVYILDQLLEKGMAICLVAHQTLEEDFNPGGQSYQRYVPMLHPKISSIFRNWSNDILYVSRAVNVKAEKGAFGSKVFKSIGEGDRILITSPTLGNALTKNTGNLPEALPFTWEAFIKFYNIKGNEEKKKEQPNG